MIVFEIVALISWILMSVIVTTVDYKFYITLTLIAVASIFYYLERVFFITNIIQFGTDHLRDMPTSKSDCYIHLVLFVENFAELLVNASKCLASDKIELNTHYKKVHISTTNAVLFEIWSSLAVENVAIMLKVALSENINI